MSPRDDYLAFFDMSTVRALEFGPADRPWIPRTTPGVRYIDHLSTEDLRKKMAVSPLYKPEDLCDIHFVNDGRPLKEILGDWTNIDLIAASHVVEHVPDLLGWFQDLSSVLAADGHVMLAVPNKRQSFDFLRRVTSLEDVIVTNLERRKKPSAHSILEQIALSTANAGSNVWNEETDHSKLTRTATYQWAIKVASENVDQQVKYFDAHVSVFTPYSFVQLLAGLTENGGLPLELERVQENGFEFLVVLKRCDANERISERLAALSEMAAKLPFNLDDYYAAEFVWREPRLKNFGAIEETALAKLRLEEELARLKGSASWRITKPLRGLRRLFH
ncbi:MAG TPA: methyltransferase domain-containing protein [Fimbriimonadaceae bacterium]|jgi:hypothetical protein